MKLSELRQDKTVKRWLSNLKPRRNTELAYLQALSAYTEYYNITPYELIAEADGEESASVRMRDRKIKDRLINFRNHLIDQKLADFTVKGRMAGVRSFYQSFDIELPKLQGERRKARTLEKNREIPTKEDLQAVLKVCDPLEKALILTGVSSGLSSVEIQNIKIIEFKKGYDPETEIVTLKIQRVKTGVEFITFLSPEASRAILEYLDFRERSVKAATPNRAIQLEKQKIVSDAGFLFILRQVDSKYLITHDEEIRKLTENAVQKLYRSISDKAKKNKEGGCYNIIRSHNMRKFFNSALLNAGCDSFHVEFWMGHMMDNVRAAYFRANPEKLKEIYAKYVPYLIIQKELNISESPDYLRIKQQNQILQAETARHVVERHELQELQAKYNEVSENLDIMLTMAYGGALKGVDFAKIKQRYKNKEDEIRERNERMLKSGIRRKFTKDILKND